MKNKIKVKVVVGHDRDYREQTPEGILHGKSLEETIYLQKKDAQKLLQEGVCDKMNPAQARTFVREYSK